MNAEHRQKVKKVLLRLNAAGNDELDQVAAFFESRTKSPYVTNTNFPMLMDIHTKPAGLFTFPRFIIWAMIYNRRKAYEKALACLNLNMKFGDYRSFYASAKAGMHGVFLQGVPLPVQIYWLTLYFKMKTESCLDNDIQSTLNDLYGSNMYQVMLDIVTRTDRLWGDFDFPHCGDCGPCPINSICDYDRWKTVVGRLNSKMQDNFPQQADLSHLFNRH